MTHNIGREFLLYGSIMMFWKYSYLCQQRNWRFIFFFQKKLVQWNSSCISCTRNLVILCTYFEVVFTWLYICVPILLILGLLSDLSYLEILIWQQSRPSTRFRSINWGRSDSTSHSELKIVESVRRYTVLYWPLYICVGKVIVLFCNSASCIVLNMINWYVRESIICSIQSPCRFFCCPFIVVQIVMKQCCLYWISFTIKNLLFHSGCYHFINFINYPENM
jgi:hypothetical protein